MKQSTVETIKTMGDSMTSILGLSGSAVGVRLLTPEDEKPAEADILHRHRYCQALMKARYGQHWRDRRERKPARHE